MLCLEILGKGCLGLVRSWITAQLWQICNSLDFSGEDKANGKSPSPK